MAQCSSEEGATAFPSSSAASRVVSKAAFSSRSSLEKKNMRREIFQRYHPALGQLSAKSNFRGARQHAEHIADSKFFNCKEGQSKDGLWRRISPPGALGLLLHGPASHKGRHENGSHWSQKNEQKCKRSKIEAASFSHRRLRGRRGAPRQSRGPARGRRWHWRRPAFCPRRKEKEMRSRSFLFAARSMRYMQSRHSSFLTAKINRNRNERKRRKREDGKNRKNSMEEELARLFSSEKRLYCDRKWTCGSGSIASAGPDKA